ncbi:MAG: murein biosynthesis integral membrane protein MurJ [Anaerolineae bacterium]
MSEPISPTLAPVPLPDDQASPSAPMESQTAGIARAAGINSLGNIASRVFGLVRESVVAGTFGASGATSAFDAISGVPKMVYELLVGGMLSAALVPVLSEYATKEREEELHHVLSILLTLVGVAMLVVTVVLELIAPTIARLLLVGFEPDLLKTAEMLIRLIVPSVFIYGLSGIIQAYHYARKRFIYPSMGAPAHNLGMIVAVVLLAGKLDIASLSLGTLAAAMAQLLMQLPGLRGAHLALRFDWNHPAIRRILKLYAPVVLSLVVSNAGIIIDRRLASLTVHEAITWMSKATFLYQLPLGLVSMAIALAVLPTLSQINAREELHRFKRTVSLSLRLVLVVIIPSAVGLLVLGRPLIELIFEHGEFAAADTTASLHALWYYVPGLPFAAIDLPLVFAFYAQKDTVTPVLVGVISVVVYLIVGPFLAFVLDWGFLGLVAANSAQQFSHAVIMLVVFARKFGGLGDYGVSLSAAKAAAASLPVAMLGLGGSLLLARLPLPGGIASEAAVVGICAALGVAGYLLAARLLRLEELDQFLAALRRKLAR